MKLIRQRENKGGRDVFYPLRENLYDKEREARYLFAGERVRGRVILEAGCGARDGALMLSRSAEKVFAIDISGEAIDIAKRNYDARNIEYLRMDCLVMRFPDKFFDAVVSLEVIEHVPDEELYLKNIARVLKDGGAYIGSTVNAERRQFGKRALKNSRHIKEYDMREYTSLLAKHFKKIRIFGQFLKKEIDAGAEEVRRRAGMADPLYLRRIFPAAFKEAILDLIRKAKGASPLGSIRADDFDFKESDQTNAGNFIVICKK